MRGTGQCQNDNAEMVCIFWGRGATGIAPKVVLCLGKFLLDLSLAFHAPGLIAGAVAVAAIGGLADLSVAGIAVRTRRTVYVIG